MNNQFSRTINLFGSETFSKIIEKKIIVFGVGGVGSAAIEALVRFGFKSIAFVDYDRVDESNLNRQIFTTRSNIGMYKCLAIKNRLEEINPDIIIDYKIKKILNNIEDFELNKYDYIIDAIDTVTAKINLIKYCNANKLNLISSMGTGNRLDVSSLKPMDIYQTSYDPLSKIIRHEIRLNGVNKQLVVSSTEKPLTKSFRAKGAKKSTPNSVSFVPPVSGYMMVSEIIKYFLEMINNE